MKISTPVYDLEHAMILKVKFPPLCVKDDTPRRIVRVLSPDFEERIMKMMYVDQLYEEVINESDDDN